MSGVAHNYEEDKRINSTLGTQTHPFPLPAWTQKEWFQTLYPFKHKFHVVDGLRMHYVDEGEGEVIVLLHGNPTWSFYYRELIKRLSKNFRVIAPDHIGLGLSERVKDKSFRAVDRVEHISSLLDSLQVKKFSLVLHDWGGPIGAFLACKRSDSIQKMVFLNTTLTETESLPKLIKRAASPLIGEFLTKITPNFVMALTTLGVKHRLSPEVVDGYRLPYASIAQRSSIWNFVSDIPFSPDHRSYSTLLELADKLKLLKDKKVLIGWGLKDPCFHRGMLNHVLAHFPSAKVLELPNASHLVLEDASDTLIPSIEKFFLDKDLLSVKDDSTPSIMYSEFTKRVTEFSDKPAIYSSYFYGDTPLYNQTSWLELQKLVFQYRRGLAELGLRAGDKVIILIPPGVDFLAITYAVLGNGAIPVFIDPGVGKVNVLKAIRDSRADVFIGATKAHILRLVGRDAFRSVRLFFSTARFSIGDTTSLSYLKAFSSSEIPPESTGDISMVAFTSGATGSPKGVIFTNEMHAAQLKVFNEQFGMHAGERDLPLLPIFSIFSLALGIAPVFAPINPMKPLDLDPSKITRVIRDLNVTYSFGSPTLWDKITGYCQRYVVDLPSLKRIFLAGAPVPVELLERVNKIIPNGFSATPYGSTEALPVTWVTAEEILNTTLVKSKDGCEGTFVGKPIKGIEIRISEITEDTLYAEPEALPVLIIGEVLVRGNNVSPLYLNRPDANSTGKLSGGWHRMGDVGYLDNEGNLYFCGRKSHAVPTTTREYFSIPVEKVFNRHKKVRRSALISISELPYIGVAIEPFPEYWPATEQEKNQLSEELRELAITDDLTKDIRHFYYLKTFPVDGRHNAKIFRDRISNDVKRGLYR